MTGLEMLNNFNIESKVYQSTKDTTFYTKEIELFLNKAKDIIVQKYYEEFDRNETVKTALDKLITTIILKNPDDISSSQDGAKSNGIIWNMYADFLYCLEESVLTDDSRYVKVKPIQRDYYNININNPYKKPNKDLVWRMDRKPASIPIRRRKELITDGTFSITEYHITYLKKLDDIDVTNNTSQIQLGDKPIKEIIDEAIMIAYNINKNNLYQQQKEQVANTNNNKQ